MPVFHDYGRNENNDRPWLNAKRILYLNHRGLGGAINASPSLKSLRDTYPAQLQGAYGWEKLITEQICTYNHEAYCIKISTVRFHNIFGPLDTWEEEITGFAGPHLAR
jgi:nucleoside-diphosphate-sugar epimerase